MKIRIIVALFIVACSGVKPTPEVAEATYLTEQLECVNKNETRVAIDACRDQVRVKWSKDGGK